MREIGIQSHARQRRACLLRAGGGGVGRQHEPVIGPQRAQGGFDAGHDLDVRPIEHRPGVLGEIAHDGIAPVENHQLDHQALTVPEPAKISSSPACCAIRAA
jgi:hypothetical protein